MTDLPIGLPIHLIFLAEVIATRNATFIAMRDAEHVANGLKGSLVR